MANYNVLARPNGFLIATCQTEREARLMIQAIESNDVREDKFEPDTYYIFKEGGDEYWVPEFYFCWGSTSSWYSSRSGAFSAPFPESMRWSARWAFLRHALTL